MVKKHIAKVNVMKNLKETMARLLILVSKKGLKSDLESTGSTWNYQPKIPVNLAHFKNKK